MLISEFSKYIFWSYKPDADLPEEIIIKQVVAYGEISDLKKMIKLIEKESIKKVLNEMRDKYHKRVNFIEKVML